MKDNHSASYFELRAEQEDEAARLAATPLTASIHRGLAERYRAKASDTIGGSDSDEFATE